MEAGAKTAAATLDAMAGPLKGASFRLAAGETTVGRDPSNTISILDGSVSRHHCVIEWNGARYTIRDLDSRNSTLVNGVPVKERKLDAGDEIRIGSSLFIFLPDENGDSTGPPSSLRLNTARAGSTIVLRKDQARYLKPPQTETETRAGDRVARDLAVLLKISRNISSLREVAAIEREALTSALQVAPADRAAILLAELASEEFSSVMALDRSGQPCAIDVSRTVVKQVLDDGVAVLSNDVADDDTLDAADSLLSRQVRSVLAVPIDVVGRPRGVLYLDTSRSGAKFDEDLLQLVTALGNIAGIAIANAQHLETLQDENRRLQEQIDIEHNMVGDSPRMREIYQFIAKVAPSDSTVLVRGESGTGKELVARAIHTNSTRAAKPFVAINCAAISETLLESELFGHEKGAFTGAIAQKKGKLETGEGGTVFLDEIGELALPLQAKLLRVLQEREFERVGGTRSIKLDVRLIAATNRNLEEAVKAGTFRQDVYYRLNVVSVRMPSLRERREDIPLLANYFAAKYAERAKRTVAGLSSAARAALSNYDWPGNVRELENAIERAVVLGSSNLILPEDLPEAVLERPAAAGGAVTRYHEGVQEAKKGIIVRALEQSDGNVTEAAKLLGVHPNYLHRLMSNLKLR